MGRRPKRFSATKFDNLMVHYGMKKATKEEELQKKLDNLLMDMKSKKVKGNIENGNWKSISCRRKQRNEFGR